MAHFIPLPKLPSAKETAQVMINHVFRIHGLPTDIVSDRGPQFVSVFWKEFCRLLGATVSLSSGYHPESNGQTERIYQELETGLRCLVAQNQTTWSQHLTWIEYAHNTLPTAATGLSPFHVVHGYQPRSVFGLRTRGYRSIGSCSGQEKSQDLGSCTGHVAERTGSNEGRRRPWPLAGLGPSISTRPESVAFYKRPSITRPFQKTGAQSNGTQSHWYPGRKFKELGGFIFLYLSCQSVSVSTTIACYITCTLLYVHGSRKISKMIRFC
ncbi:hypothetical protein L3Q82_004103 [Scortum barcoo]|uniref:Uncharacterized protein n=1 Tax=Scortum barcoo TaxID=214431 RepID=A0ACB8X6A8_9TELE|nr:hypothetical protein L3Q82_004103 [Scortum barcoo]